MDSTINHRTPEKFISRRKGKGKVKTVSSPSLLPLTGDPDSNIISV
jgi:hypothetical protein